MAHKYFDSFARVLSRAFKLPLLAVILAALWSSEEDQLNETPAIYFSFLTFGLLMATVFEQNDKVKHYATLPQDIVHEYFENFAIFSFSMSQVFQFNKALTYALSSIVALAPAYNEFDEYLLHHKNEKSGNFSLVLRSLLRSSVLLSLFVVINDFYEQPLVSNDTQRASFGIYFSLDLLLHKLIHYKASLAHFNTIEKAETVAYEFLSRLFLNFEIIMILAVSLYGANEFPNALYTPAGLLSPLLAILSAYEQAYLKPFYYRDKENHEGEDLLLDSNENSNSIEHDAQTPYHLFSEEIEERTQGASRFTLFKKAISDEINERYDALKSSYFTVRR